MDINDLRGVSTVLVMIAFIAVTAWAYSSKRKKSFDEAAQLPFADDQGAQASGREASASDDVKAQETKGAQR